MSLVYIFIQILNTQEFYSAEGEEGRENFDKTGLIFSFTRGVLFLYLS